MPTPASKHTPTRRRDGRETEEQLYRTALSLFRKKGYTSTTMRDIAKAAGMSLGATYHYFPTKAALVMRFYREHHDEYAHAVLDALPKTSSLRERLAILYSLKFELLENDRAMLQALIPEMVTASSPLFLFGEASQELVVRHLALYTWALSSDFQSGAGDAEGALPSESERLCGAALWGLQLLLLFLFVHDHSDRQQRTHQVLQSGLPALEALLPMALGPFGGMWLSKVRPLLEAIGLADMLNGEAFDQAVRAIATQ